MNLCVCRVVSEDDFEGSRKEGVSDDELFEPYSDTRWAQFFLGIIINLSEQDKETSADRNPDVYLNLSDTLPELGGQLLPTREEEAKRCQRSPKSKRSLDLNLAGKISSSLKGTLSYLTQPKHCLSFDMVLFSLSQL